MTPVSPAPLARGREFTLVSTFLPYRASFTQLRVLQRQVLQTQRPLPTDSLLLRQGWGRGWEISRDLTRSEGLAGSAMSALRVHYAGAKPSLALCCLPRAFYFSERGGENTVSKEESLVWAKCIDELTRIGALWPCYCLDPRANSSVWPLNSHVANLEGFYSCGPPWGAVWEITLIRTIWPIPCFVDRDAKGQRADTSESTAHFQPVRSSAKLKTLSAHLYDMI